MNYRRLGKSGLQVSELSLGSWLTFGGQISDDVALELMRVAYDAGVNFFDNAEGYAAGKSEIVMGECLKKLDWRRDTFTVSSKVFWGGGKPNQTGLSKKHVFEACDFALKRLQVDYLDLYFCHRPDPNTPIEETVRTMHELILRGKVLYWGTSEWSAQEIMEAYAIARQEHLTPPTMEQPQYSMLVRKRFEQEYARLYTQIGLGTTIWSPLAGGLLTGKYNDGIPEGSRAKAAGMDWWTKGLTGPEADRKFEVLRQVKQVADELGTSMAKLAIAWTLKNRNVSTVILGATRVEQLKETLTSGEVVPRLTDDVMKRLDDLTKVVVS